jgi:hypothetical protein
MRIERVAQSAGFLARSTEEQRHAEEMFTLLSAAAP